MAKFKLNQKVLVDGKPGVVVEVGAHDGPWLAAEEQQYSVRLDEFIPIMQTADERGPLKKPIPARDDDGKPLGQYQTLGCVLESAIKTV